VDLVFQVTPTVVIVLHACDEYKMGRIELTDADEIRACNAFDLKHLRRFAAMCSVEERWLQFVEDSPV
jgi:hypothetical protein